LYEARLVKPQSDFDGRPIYEAPWIDVGSHRIYFFEITAIQLELEIATGRRQIHWRALPRWLHKDEAARTDTGPAVLRHNRYQKGYNPNYSYPSENTIAFEYDEVQEGMAVKYLPPLPKDQVEVDNDRARWPCFFPSSCGLITTWAENGAPNVMPCGSTTVVSRHPFIIAPCISYARINERYAPRKTLEFIERRGRFGCSVPYLTDVVVRAIKYAGNNSLADDPDKLRNAGFSAEDSDFGPVISEAPIHFDCEVIGKVLLGTHIMFLGKVSKILVRGDVTPETPLEWYPLASVD
jgi:flavin reductase (DIM6/NTAB) family NADH-FMN oxidoreductase RutF